MSVVALPMGPLAVLLETDGDPVGLARQLRATVDGVVEVVPAARTVLVTARDRGVVEHVRALVATGVLTSIHVPTDRGGAALVEVPVRYDGEDLEDVAARTGLDVGDVVRRHAAPVYRVAFCGFAPGFAYLEHLDPALALPRRATPRTSVPAGSVAIAAGYSAVYPSSSPGGWHLIGTTDLEVWAADRTPPAVLTPGTRVRFVAER